MTDTELRYMEQDDEYMYFEVVHKYVSQGTIYIGKVKPIDRDMMVQGEVT